MAFANFLERTYGKPRVSANFGIHEVDGERIVNYSVTNEPINNRVLEILGVARMAIDNLWIRYQVYGSLDTCKRGNLIIDEVPSIWAFDGLNKAQCISLPASRTVGIEIASYSYKTKETKVKEQVLKQGCYDVCIQLHIGAKCLEHWGEFNISSTPPEIIQLTRISIKDNHYAKKY